MKTAMVLVAAVLVQACSGAVDSTLLDRVVTPDTADAGDPKPALGRDAGHVVENDASDPPTVDATPGTDARVDSGADSGAAIGLPDTGLDTGPAPSVDAGVDSGVDAATEATVPQDAGQDTNPAVPDLNCQSDFSKVVTVQQVNLAANVCANAGVNTNPEWTVAAVTDACLSVPWWATWGDADAAGVPRYRPGGRAGCVNVWFNGQTTTCCP